MHHQVYGGDVYLAVRWPVRGQERGQGGELERRGQIWDRNYDNYFKLPVIENLNRFLDH